MHRIFLLACCLFSLVSHSAIGKKKSSKYALGFGVQYGTHLLGEIHVTKGSGNSLFFQRKSVGLEFSPLNTRRYVGGKLAYHTNVLKVVQLGGNTILYADGNKLIPTLRPEIGYSANSRKLDIRVGYNFHLINNSFTDRLHTFHVSVHYFLWVKK